MKESSPPHGFDGLEPPPSSGNSFHMVYSGNFLASMGYLILSRPPLVTVRGTILLPPIVKRHFRCLPLKIKKSVWLYHCELYFCRKNAFCRYWFHVLNEYFITCFKWNPTLFLTVLILSEIYHRPPTRGVILGKHSYDSISALIIIIQP